MGISKKLLLLIALTLAAVLAGVTLLIGINVVDNNERMVDSLAERLRGDNLAAAELLTKNSKVVEDELSMAQKATREIVLGLYDSSFETLAGSLTNQIFPMVESFDFDSPKGVIDRLMEANGAITGIRFATSPTPSARDIYSFGDLEESVDRKTYSREIQGDFAYIKVEMQVSLAGLQSIETVAGVFARINENNQQLVNELTRSSNESLAGAEQFARQVGEEGQHSLIRTSALMMLVALVLVCCILGYCIHKFVTRPMALTVAMIEDMEQGHLDTRLNMRSGDEIGQMARAMDAFAENLQQEVVENLQKLAKGDLNFTVSPRDDRDVLRGSLQKLGEDLNGLLAEVQASGGQISSGAEVVNEASQSLSKGASDQAAALEEITSSMNILAEQTQDNAQGAEKANAVSVEAQTAADRGNQQMQAMVQAMAEINESSQNISKIIKTIDEIAFQTNLLALNAAVEAARAGQHGKGFAVVAEEVRNLAARSAAAARETADLIAGSVAKTEKGSAIADDTAVALEQIVGGITQVSALVKKITKASTEQAEGISQINSGLGQIDQVTQRNSSNAAESASAAESLFSQADSLRLILNRFKLKESGIRALPQPTVESANLEPLPLRNEPSICLDDEDRSWG